MGKDWSTKADIQSGVPQGSVLGLIQLTILGNYLQECVQSSCKVFANHAKIYDLACNYTKIQEDIYRLQEWCNMWDLFIKVTKCKVMHMQRKNEEIDYKMKVNQDECKSIAKCNRGKGPRSYF